MSTKKLNFNQKLLLNLKDDVILAYKMNGKPLAPEHGYPLRVVVPGKYGMKWTKCINKIELTDKDYKGYWGSPGMVRLCRQGQT